MSDRKATRMVGDITAKEFSKLHGIPLTTLLRSLDRGWSSWPRRTISGRSKDSAYKCWENMIQRATNAKREGAHNYMHVGVCDRWRLSFDWFLEDMGPRPGPEYSIDRIDPYGDYEPSNCRWATREQQMRNRRKPVGYIVKHRLRWVVRALDAKIIESFLSLEEAEKRLEEIRLEFGGK